MKYLLLLALLGAQWAFAQTKPILRGEYYFDNVDPGYGNATPIAVPQPTEDLALTFSVPTTGLAPGVHQIDIRFQRDSAWSDTHRRLFYVNRLSRETEDTVQITAAEYYFGSSDPGYGNATPLSVLNPGNQVTLIDEISLSSLTPGFHDVSIRLRAEDGMWSDTHTRFFYLPDTVSRFRLSRIDYEVRQGSNVLSTGSVPISPQQYAVEVAFDVNTSSLAAGSYDFCATAVDEADRESEALCRNFVVQNLTSVADPIGAALRVYPNPSRGPLTVEASQAPVLSYRLMDAQGRVLRQERPTPGSTQVSLDLSTLPAATYYLAIEQPGLITVRAVVKR